MLVRFQLALPNRSRTFRSWFYLVTITTRMEGLWFVIRPVASATTARITYPAGATIFSHINHPLIKKSPDTTSEDSRFSLLYSVVQTAPLVSNAVFIDSSRVSSVPSSFVGTSTSTLTPSAVNALAGKVIP